MDNHVTEQLVKQNKKQIPRYYFYLAYYVTVFVVRYMFRDTLLMSSPHKETSYDI